MRDLKRIGVKLRYVLFPRAGPEEKAMYIKDWDLWGPLLICLFMALTLSFANSTDSSADTASLVFGVVFVVIWIGAGIVTVNALFLGGKVSFFQSVCLLGYCVFPMCLSAILVVVLSFLPGVLRILLVLAGFGWSTWASVGFISALVPSDRKALAEYPVFLFYLFLAWFILVT